MLLTGRKHATDAASNPNTSQNLPPAASLKTPAGPPDSEWHNVVAALAAPGAGGWPRCWQLPQPEPQKGQRVCPSLVSMEEGREYNAVTGYFMETVGRELQIVGLSRVQNFCAYKRYSRIGGETVMFHGCRSQVNEESIIAMGFDVSRCRSGGSGYGTWFAYAAAYSTSGFTFADAHGIEHIFVCVVSYKSVALDNITMRVVGQGCAYPLWLLTYRQRACNPPRQFVGRQSINFFEARDGRWVPVLTSEGRGDKRDADEPKSGRRRIRDR